jgi:predicted Zn finger-like uncharacterized protein
MTITCPSCKRKYRLQDALIRSPYQKMRCSRCGHVFIHGQKYSAQEDDASAGKPLLSPPGIVEREAAKRSGGKRVRILVISIVLAAILAVCGYYYWTNYPGASDRRLSIQKMEGLETVTKDGRAFFIKGVVLNRSTKARKFVILRAKLFDEQRGPMGERFVLAGLQLSKEEVEQMRKPDIEARITEFRKSNVNAFILQPSKEMPFSIVFSDPYTGKPKEFTVEIMEAPKT